MHARKVFSLRSYKNYLMSHKQMSEEQADILISLNGYAAYDGVEFDALMAQGHLLLEIWCEDEVDL